MRLPTGFVDLQVNGFLGVDFSSPALTEEDFVLACRALLAQGTAAFLPTVITSTLDTYARNLPMMAEVMAREEFQGRLLGFHLEGPFISRVPGAVGAHNPAYVRDPDVALLEQLLNWAGGRVRLLTLAAELPGAEDLARCAVERGVAVSIGHSLFTTADLDRMADAGATALTHLGNGLPNMLPRHDNPLWVGLAHDAYTAMLIADGHHLPASVIKGAARAKGADKLIVVSDASPVAGLPPGRYRFLDNDAILEPSGRFHNPEKQCLVGSSATMAQCMAHLASLGELTEAELVRVGRINPLGLIKT
ncbi:MAG TPA: N-acetylglucosamine-6-phosphate deacetylase [Anaerolineae bacterium]|nr:N-acetylglucosamine-6-phosphate deacetylase [Anaerolineae bacterium]HQI86319.1 N-acetylglucosamine-6-phosphate deacetylase [Anaerolineae bacterium]